MKRTLNEKESQKHISISFLWIKWFDSCFWIMLLYGHAVLKQNYIIQSLCTFEVREIVFTGGWHDVELFCIKKNPFFFRFDLHISYIYIKYLPTSICTVHSALNKTFFYVFLLLIKKLNSLIAKLNTRVKKPTTSSICFVFHFVSWTSTHVLP